MFDSFALVWCAIGALFGGFVLMALILEHVVYRLRQTRRHVKILKARNAILARQTRRLRRIDDQRMPSAKITNVSTGSAEITDVDVDRMLEETTIIRRDGLEFSV